MALDSWLKLQRAPFGGNTALNQGTGSPGMRSLVNNSNALSEAYRRAGRLLKRRARRGDVNAALQEIQLRTGAMAAGQDMSGITSAEETSGGQMAMAADLARRADQAAAARAQADSVLGTAAPDESPPKPDADPSSGVDIDYSKTPPQSQRQLVDMNLGEIVKNKESTADIESIAASLGVSTADFERRKKWWENKHFR